MQFILNYPHLLFTNMDSSRANMEKIVKAQRAMERQMLNVKSSDRRRNERIRSRIRVKNVREEVAK